MTYSFNLNLNMVKVNQHDI